ncbi:putative pumilio homolog 16 [Papaver somniferum]|uniref:putative pumilio homolog 16 n=1 Tax=Papaver somniferum TaxID=3469 RepID=UPI000E6FCAF1|nr:putative pumilio homolog 16 [Papaver somniferum]
MADLETHYQPNSPVRSPTCNTIPTEDEDEEEQIVYDGPSQLSTRSFTNGTTDSNLMNNGWGSSLGASSSKKRSISIIPNMISHGYMNGLGSSSGTSSFPAPPSLPTEDELLSSFQGLLSVEEQKLCAAYGASNSMITSPGQLSTHSFTNGTMDSNLMNNGWGSSLGTSSWKYPSFEHSTMINQGNYVGNSFVNSRHHPFFSLKMQGWNDYRIMKIMNDDPSLLDKLNGYDILKLGSHKLGCKYLMKLLCNEGEAPRLTRLLGSSSADFFKAIVYVIAKEVNTKSGSRAMESLLIKLLMGNPMLIVYVLRSMKPSLFPVMLNQNGSQLVQKLCIHVPNMYLGDIYEIAVINCIKLSTTEQGCFALKAIIDSIVDPLKTQLLSIIIGEAVFLSAHNYGNFVVQHVLERHPYTASLISNELISKKYLFPLSKNKYGSNVVEKCIESNATDVVVSQLLSDCKQLVELAQDKFGNYVIQKALKLTKGKALRQLVDVLQKCSSELENHPTGRNVYNLIKRFKLHKELVIV